MNYIFSYKIIIIIIIVIAEGRHLNNCSKCLLEEITKSRPAVTNQPTVIILYGHLQDSWQLFNNKFKHSSNVLKQHRK